MNPRKEIIIIHSSAVIRKGIQAILSDMADVRFHLFGHPDQVMKRSFLPDESILFIIQEDHLAVLLEKFGQNLQSRSIIFSNRISNDHMHDHLSDEEIFQKVAGKFTGHDSTDSEETMILSQREQEILKHVAMGNSSKEIADKLFISTHTVISHRKNITEKLGIKSISGLTLYAFLNKIIDPEELKRTNLI